MLALKLSNLVLSVNFENFESWHVSASHSTANGRNQNSSGGIYVIYRYSTMTSWINFQWVSFLNSFEKLLIITCFIPVISGGFCNAVKLDVLSRMAMPFRSCCCWTRVEYLDLSAARRRWGARYGPNHGFSSCRKNIGNKISKFQK